MLAEPKQKKIISKVNHMRNNSRKQCRLHTVFYH